MDEEELQQPKVFIQIPVTWLVPGIMIVVLSPLLAILASVKIADGQRKAAQRAQAAAELRQQEQSRIVVCGLFSAILDTYIETPPNTAAGRNVQQTWLDLYKLSNCQPPRTR